MSVDIEAEEQERECLIEMAEEVMEDLEAFLTRHFTPVQFEAIRMLSLAFDYEVRDLPVEQQKQVFARRRKWATRQELRTDIEGRLWAIKWLVALFPTDPAVQHDVRSERIMERKMTSVRIGLGQSEAYIYAETTEAELQQWLALRLHPDDLVSLLLARNGSLFYRDWHNSATIFYRKNKTVTMQYFHEGQEHAPVQEFATEA